MRVRKRSAIPQALLGGFCIVFVVTFYKLLSGSGFGETEQASPTMTQTRIFQTKSTQSPTLTIIKTESDSNTINVAVLVIACNRPSVRRCLDLLLKTRPSQKGYPIIVSQDCGHQETANVIRSYGDKVKFLQQPDLSDPKVTADKMHLLGYYKLSRHYKWALTQVFDVMKYDSVIIVEDDLEVSPDFFEYFTAALPVLYKDPTLWCISAWNDNGKDGYVMGNEILYRSDFFPGLGWAMTHSTWGELRSKWPDAFWDDWMRHPDQRKGRACIRPEVPRTKTFGRVGVSNGQFYDQHLSKIKLNNKFYPFTNNNMSFLMKNKYDRIFKENVYSSKLVSVDDLLSKRVEEDTVRIEYSSNSDFISIAKRFGLMSDLKAGVPRMAYLGIVSFIHGHYRVYLAARKDWSGYTDV